MSIRLVTFVLLLCVLPETSLGYSVLTHQQLIDLTWKDLLRPQLHERFPHASEAELDRAHAYAYGGCAIQDLGYYPFSNELFSNLTHYVRSGDFITNLLRDARDTNELAFAMGALSHYVGDTVGHQDAINRATAIAFPKLARRYGASVAYYQSPHAHIRTEFAFDIDELSRHRLAPGAYLRAVGLRVPSDLLAKAFEETYSLPLGSVVGPHRPAIRSYRSSVRSFLPRFAHAETVIHRNDFPAEIDNDSLQIFLDRVQRGDFQTEWTHYRGKAGITTHLLAWMIVILPRIGALSDLAIKIPTPETQDLYIKSVNRAIAVYAGYLHQRTGALPNCNLDTGEKDQAGADPLTDKTYAVLLHKIVQHPRQPVAADLKRDILDHYRDAAEPVLKDVRKDLSELQK